MNGTWLGGVRTGPVAAQMGKKKNREKMGAVSSEDSHYTRLAAAAHVTCP